MEETINRSQMIQLCAKTLRLCDNRLVDHGERVAYLAERIAAYLEPSLFERKMLLLLSVFHDVGAYKTEEIDRMVEFETVNVQAHSIYGYLFLKYFAPIGPLSRTILYHHTDTRQLADIDPEIRCYADLIHLADRADIAIMTGCSPERLKKALHQPCFCPAYVEALDKALEDGTLARELRSGMAAKYMAQELTQLPLSVEEAVQYLKMLVYSIDFKSEFTVVHSVNTTVISLYLAWYRQLSIPEMEKIYYAALIHDVGKMGVPVSILEYSGRLDEDDMEIMRQHVVYTENLVLGILPPEIVSIAVRHHEKLDGSGYPRGLTAEELSPSDRIVAVADIISALSSRRSYKEPFPKERILEILNHMAASGELDSEIVALVNTRYEDLQKVMQEKTAPIYQLYQQMQAEYHQLIQAEYNNHAAKSEN